MLALRERDGHQVYVIQSVPLEDAAVEWGREVPQIRDDWIVLEQQFRDQDDVLVKMQRAPQLLCQLSRRALVPVLEMSALFRDRLFHPGHEIYSNQ